MNKDLGIIMHLCINSDGKKPHKKDNISKIWQKNDELKKSWYCLMHALFLKLNRFC